MWKKTRKDGENMTEEFNDEKQGISSWIQDNLRIMISIFIVILVAGAVYSYSKRSVEEIAVSNEELTEEEMLQEILNDGNQEAAQEESEDVVENAQKDDQIQEADEPTEETTPEVAREEETKEVAVIEETSEETANEEENANEEESETTEAAQEEAEVATPVEKEISATQNVSQETEESFIETAVSGEGLTHLARKSLRDYLEKNPDSSLTPEHKVYIEDYLRKKIGFQEGVHVGTSVEFSKSLIQQAIASSKNLNDSQLKNLEKYSALVSQ